MRTFINYTIDTSGAGLTVEIYLKQTLHYSGRKIQKLTRLKGLFLNGKPAYLQRKLKEHDTLRVLMPEDISYGVEPEQGVVTLLYEDDQIVVVDKPPNILVHPAGQTSSGTLANHLAYVFKQRGVTTIIRPLHRLDKNTSGCVVFAKDAHSQHLLEQQLKSGTFKRTYQALVKGIVTPSAATIKAPIGAHPTLPNRRSVSEHGEPAVTHYRTLRQFNGYTLLELELDTGRTHQIRVHLAHFGYPIIGDAMYGTRSPLINRQALHARQVTFRRLQDDYEISISAPLPDDFLRAITYCEQ